MSRLSAWHLTLTSCALSFALFGTTPAGAYEPEIHQQLTFMAARQFNRCAEMRPDLEPLSALDTRYIVKANVGQSDSNMFVRMFRWNYYNRADQSNRSTLGVIDTRFHDHFDALTRNLRRADERQQRLRQLGRVLMYVQDVSSPPHAVPVYTGRWWRLSFSDRFNRFPVDAPQTEQALEDSCAYLFDTELSYHDVLKDVAADTITSVQGQIFGFPATWEAYWELAEDAEDFGEYGPAGNNFGQRTEFRCGDRQRCLLLEDDPLYHGFAMDRHVAAVIATMRAMVLLQTNDEAEDQQVAEFDDQTD